MSRIKGYGLTAEAIEKLRRMRMRLDASPLRDGKATDAAGSGGAARATHAPPTRWHAWVRITSAEADNGRYPGLVVNYIAEDDSWEDQDDTEVWVRTANGGELDDTAARMWGRLEGDGAGEDEEDIRGVYVVGDCAACTGTWECQAVEVPPPTVMTCGQLSSGAYASYKFIGSGFSGSTACTALNTTFAIPYYFSCSWEVDLTATIGWFFRLSYDSSFHKWHLHLFHGGLQRYQYTAGEPPVWDGITPLVLTRTTETFCTTAPLTLTIEPDV